MNKAQRDIRRKKRVLEHAARIGNVRKTCQPHLRSVITAALETGMQDGEISSLQWTQVEELTVTGSTVTWAAQASLMLPFGRTKTRRLCRIPISSRLKAILEMRRFDPAGHPFSMDRYVFGNEIGAQVESHEPGRRPCCAHTVTRWPTRPHGTSQPLSTSLPQFRYDLLSRVAFPRHLLPLAGPKS